MCKLTKIKHGACRRYLADIQESPFLVCCLDNIQDELSTWTSLFPAVQPTVCE